VITLRAPGESWREAGFYWGYRSAQRLAETLPESVGVPLFSFGGALAHRFADGARAVVAANQAQVLGADVDDELVAAATREAFRLYARYWYDAFRLRALTTDEMDARTKPAGYHNLDEALAKGKGVICVLPHLGNWDVPGYHLAMHGYPIAAVAEVLRPERLSDIFMSYRRELGLRIIPLTKDGHVGQQLKGLLAENWIVALVADRDLGGRGVEVEMFGRKRRVPAGPALLSLTTGAPICVCPVRTLERGWSVTISAPLAFEPTGDTRRDVVGLSRVMAGEFERAIAACPPDWHMFQRAWEPEPASVAAP
jgi:phosphatidylinositol dimannoside acyltransferase